MNRSELSCLLDIYDSFLLLSSFSMVSQDFGHGQQLISSDDKLFQQHLTKQRIYPGSMILEGALQSAAALIYLRFDRAFLPIIYSVNSRLFKPIIQDDSLLLTHKVSISKHLRGLCDIQSETYCRSSLISKYRFAYSLRPVMNDNSDNP